MTHVETANSAFVPSTVLCPDGTSVISGSAGINNTDYEISWSQAGTFADPNAQGWLVIATREGQTDPGPVDVNAFAICAELS